VPGKKEIIFGNKKNLKKTGKIVRSKQERISGKRIWTRKLGNWKWLKMH